MKLFGKKRPADEQKPVHEENLVNEAKPVTQEELAEASALDSAPSQGGDGARLAASGAQQAGKPSLPPPLPPGVELTYETDGVYLTLKANKSIAPDVQQQLIRHFARKDIKALNKHALQNALSGESVEHMLLAPPQHEHVYDQAYTLAVESNHMEAFLTLLPPEEGRGMLLDPQTVLRELREVHKLQYGLNEETVLRMLDEGIYDEKICIAKGQPPQPGIDGRLEFYFDHERVHDASSLRQAGETEKVDHKNLDLFEHVKKDQLLVTKILPTEGVPGITVLGKPVSAPGGKLYNLPVGKNTYISEDKRNMHAKEGGRVDYINGYVEVSSCYTVDGDVNLSVGNIDFDGDVSIRGNVMSGYTIKATGNIEVMGIVESSVLEADKDIVIRGGMQGAGKGMLSAGGGVFVRFVEYSTVQATDVVVTESLLHSNVNCSGPVEVLNGRGSIVGGNVCAGTYIAARFIGNTGGRTTQLEVGVSPSHRAELLSAQETVAALRDVVNKLQRMVQLPPLKKESDRQKAARIEAIRKLLVQKKVLDDNTVILERIKEQIEEMHDGQVHVLMTAYPGVTINIAFDRYTVQEPTAYATFRMEENTIGFTSCRFKQQPTSIKRIKKR